MMSRILFCVVLVVGLHSCVQKSEPIGTEEKLAKLDSIIIGMQDQGNKMSNMMDSVAHFYAFLLTKKDSILSRNPAMKYRFDGAFSVTVPALDSISSTVIILNSTPDRSAASREVLLTDPMDSVFAHFYRANPIVAQVYSNSSTQVSRVYPPFDAKTITDPNIDVRDFNFFYEADRAHNPSRNLVWIPDAYIDPAGKGWILSVVHPVYDRDSLFAVVGVDITVTDLVETYFETVPGELLLINGKADIVAGKSSAIESLSLPPLKNHVYRETVKSNYFRVSDFNLFNSKSKEVRDMARRLLQEGDSVFTFSTEPQLTEAVIRRFSEIDWYLIEIFPKQ